MKSEYRFKRASVTEAIKSKVFNLVKNEKDTGSKKKHPTKWYRGETAKSLGLEESENPSLRSYEELVRKIKNHLKKPNSLDRPWSFASLKDNPISSEDLADVWKACVFIDKEWWGRWPTVREVNWYVRLRAMPVGYKSEPNRQTPQEHMRKAFGTGLFYARLEMFGEMLGEQIDTRFIDSDSLEHIEDNFAQNSAKVNKYHMDSRRKAGLPKIG
jgi:hypothetical protein